MKEIRVGSQVLSLSEPVVMAIVNVTPDSFFSDSRVMEYSSIRERVRGAVADGASILDVGGYSSRPGAVDVSPEEELRRVCIAVEIARDESPDSIISIDTFRASVVRGVVSRFGACVVNDISAGELDVDMIDTVAELGMPYIAMHMRGTPADMQSQTQYSDVVDSVVSYLTQRVELARSRGVKDIIIDPGFGFAKTASQNYELLGGMSRLKEIGVSVLAGLSRKSMIYKVLDCTPAESLAGSIALGWECLSQGVDILRVHDVRQAVDTVKLFNYYHRYGKL